MRQKDPRLLLLIMSINDKFITEVGDLGMNKWYG
ncbi:MAG: hypothetical protein RLZZ176_3119 [Cyanobacteriota bacterium]